MVSIPVGTTKIEGLPLGTRWLLAEDPFTFDFAAARYGLVSACEVVDARSFRHAWRALSIFGATDYAAGGGSRSLLTVDRLTGAVLGLDLERDDPVYLLNSSLAQFVATFKYLDAYLARRRALPHDAKAFVKTIDAAGYPNSEWRVLLAFLLR